MRERIAIIGIACVLLSSCYAPLQTEEYGNGTNLRWDIPDTGSTTVASVLDFVAQHVAYATDIENHSEREYWQTPQETYASDLGDCEDYVILAMYLLRSELGIESRMIRGWNSEEGHAWIEIEGRWWDVELGGVYLQHKYFDTWPHRRESLGYGEVMYRAEIVKE